MASSNVGKIILPSLTPTQPNLSKFKIALCQMLVTSDKERNIAHAREMIGEAAAKGAKLVALPEMWNCPLVLEKLSIYAEELYGKGSSPSTQMLSEAAYHHGITVVGGSIPEWSAGHLYNTCCVYGPNGKLKAKHRKLHLFDFDILGQTTFKESGTLTAGYQPTIVDTDVGRIGIGICHDIRFPELGILYRSRGCALDIGAQLICYPGAFNLSTGEPLWELMQRARAVDNQLFVATCSPSRNSDGDYVKWGHSSLIGPVGELAKMFGEIIATTGHEEAIIIAEVDYSQIQLRRESLPLMKQKVQRDIPNG